MHTSYAVNSISVLFDWMNALLLKRELVNKRLWKSENGIKVSDAVAKCFLLIPIIWMTLLINSKF